MMKYLLLMTLLGACSSTSGPKVDKSRPLWVDGQDPEFPSDTYWVGVGSGKTRGEASQNARGELSKRIESKVSTSESSSSSEATGSKENYAFEKNVSLQSSAVLNGTRIAKWYEDPTSKENYALAILRKGEFLAEIQSKLNKLDDALEALPKTLVNSFRAEELIREREFWEKHFSAVSGGAAVENPWEMNSEELVNFRNGVLQKFPFKLVGEELSPILQEMLQQMGVVINPASNNELKVDVKTADYPSSPNIKRQKITVKLDAITEKSKSTVILSEIGIGHSEIQALEDGYKKMREKQLPKLFAVVKALGDVKFQKAD